MFGILAHAGATGNPLADMERYHPRPPSGGLRTLAPSGTGQSL